MISSAPSALFRDRGYIVIRNAVPKAEADAFVCSAINVYDSEPWLDPCQRSHGALTGLDLLRQRVTQLDERLPGRRRLQLSLSACEVLTTLMADEPVLLSEAVPFRYSPSRSRPKGDAPGRDPVRNAHVHHYSHCEPVCGSVMGWLALEDITPAAGPMWVDPGSHKRNVALFDELLAAHPPLAGSLARLRERGAPYEVWGDWMMRLQSVITDELERRIDEGGGERLLVLVGAGDLVLFDSALTHGTLPPSNLDATRWSMVARYQGRHTVERSWASWLGGSRYAPAITHVPPASYQLQRCEGTNGWFAVNHTDAHMRMFWAGALAG
jgi:hypothetical protein